MSVQISYKKQFTFGLMLFLVLLASVEIVIRVYEHINPVCDFYEKDAFFDVDFSLQKQICQDTNYLQYEEPNILMVKPNQHFQTISINEYGFRGPEIDINKKSDTFRIFVVGGSTAFGHGSTSDLTTIPGFLQTIIDNSGISKNIEVINAGKPRATSSDESFYIKNHLRNYEPDLIIIYDGANDARGKYLDKTIIAKTTSELSIFENIKRYGAFEKGAQIYRTPFVINDFFIDVNRSIIGQKTTYNDSNDELVKKISSLWTERWIDICNENELENISTVIILQPMVGTGTKVLSPDELTFLPTHADQHDSISILQEMSLSLSILDEHCTKTADFRNIFDNTSRPIFYDDVHVVDKGNEIIAREIFSIITPLIK